MQKLMEMDKERARKVIEKYNQSVITKKKIS